MEKKPNNYNKFNWKAFLRQIQQFISLVSPNTKNQIKTLVKSNELTVLPE